MSLLRLSYGRATGGQAMHNGTSLGFAVYQFSNQSPQHTFPLSVFHSNSSTHLDSTHVFAAPQFLIFQLSHFPTQHSPGYSPLSTSSPAGISVPMDFVRSPVLGCVLAHPTVSSLFCPNPYTPPLNSSQFQSNSASTSIPLEFLQFNSSRLCISQLCHLRPQHCPGACPSSISPVRRRQGPPTPSPAGSSVTESLDHTPARGCVQAQPAVSSPIPPNPPTPPKF